MERYRTAIGDTVDPLPPWIFKRLHHEGELADALLRELVELQVLQQMDAVHHQRDLVHRQRQLLVRIGRDFHRPVVGAEQHRVLGDEPLRRLHADAGAGLHIARIVLAVELAPAGVDEHRIARLQRQVLLLQRAFEVVDRDLVVVAEHLDALEARDVDQHAAREQRADSRGCRTS